MSRFCVGDTVIVRDQTKDENQWSFYLDGSVGVIKKYNAHSYSFDFIDVVDAQPTVRIARGHNLDWLAKNACISDSDLEPYEFEEVDNGFDSVFN